MADPKGFLKVTGARAARASPRRRCASWTGKRSTSTGDPAAAASPGRPLHGLRRPVLPQGVPARQPASPSGTTSCGAARAVQAIERLHATNNFPEFTGRLCPAPVRVVVRARHQPARRDHQAGRGLDHRPGVRATAGSQPAPAGAPHRQDRRRRRLRPRRASPPPSSSTRAGHTVAVYERDDRIGGLLRYGIPDFKMEKRHLEPRLAQMQAEGTRFRAGVEIGVDLTWAELRARYDAVVIATGRHRAARPADPRAATSLGVHFAMEYLVAAEQGRRGRPGPATRSPRTGKHVVVIGGGDTGADCIGTAHRQGALSVTNLAIGKQPPASRPDHQPWPMDPTLFEVSVRARGGRRARLPRVDRRVPRATRPARSARSASPRPSTVDGRRVPEVGHRARDPRRPRAASRWGSPGPSATALDEQLRPPFDRPRQRRRATTTTQTERAGRLRRRRRGPRPVAHRVGDRRGPRGGVRGRPVP